MHLSSMDSRLLKSAVSKHVIYFLGVAYTITSSPELDLNYVVSNFPRSTPYFKNLRKERLIFLSY